ARLLVEQPLDQGAVIVGAAVLDRVHGAGAVEHADLQVLELDQPHLPGGELGDRADVDDLWHLLLSPSGLIGYSPKSSAHGAPELARPSDEAARRPSSRACRAPTRPRARGPRS